MPCKARKSGSAQGVRLPADDQRAEIVDTANARARRKGPGLADAIDLRRARSPHATRPRATSSRSDATRLMDITIRTDKT